MGGGHVPHSWRRHCTVAIATILREVETASKLCSLYPVHTVGPSDGWSELLSELEMSVNYFVIPIPAPIFIPGSVLSRLLGFGG
jgi:hypothetical protein